jgi:hypothetical protein
VLECLDADIPEVEPNGIYEYFILGFTLFAWNCSLDHTTVTLGGYLGILYKDKNLLYSHGGFADSFVYITQ